MAGTVSIPAFWHAWSLRCPEITSYSLFSSGLTVMSQQPLGENAPHQLVHFRIVFYLEGMSFKGAQVFGRQLHSLYNVSFIQWQWFPFY